MKISIFKAVGAVKKGYDPPHQYKDWHMAPESLLNKYVFVDELKKFSEEVDLRDRQPGDILIFSYAGVQSHLGIVVEDDCFIHAVSGRKVMRSSVKSHLGKLRGVYRING